MNKPSRLCKGDTIGIIAPASGIKDYNRMMDGINVLTALGYNVIPGKSCFEKNGFLSGTDMERLYDLNLFFLNPDIKAIICLRGGYGSMRILQEIDYNLIKKNPKIFVGYSDITALHFAIFKECNLVSFHGPMVYSDIADNDPFTINNLIGCLEGRIESQSFCLNPLVCGNCSGRLFGGNLSLICSIISSKYNINWENKILFIEDTGEEPYSIDRMLYQLKLAGLFNKIEGIILGQFTECKSNDADSQTVVEVLDEFFYNFNIPVYSGLAAGHGLHKITIPMGINIKIIDNILKFTEEGVNSDGLF